MRNLELGDIIIFKAEDNWLSKAIAYLTDSDVCHAAMVYSEDSLVEISAAGPVISKIQFQPGDGAYVLHLRNSPSPAPLIKAADKYLHSETRYDFPALLTLGWLLIYRKLTPTVRLFTVIEHLFALINLTLDDLIQHALLHHFDRAMVCSQLIYQIFYDCGKDYRVQIKNGTLWESISAHTPADSVRLFDIIRSESAAVSSPSASSLYHSDFSKNSFSEKETELLVMELCQALAEAEPKQTKTAANVPITDRSVHPAFAASLAKNFLDRLQELMNLLHCDMPIDSLFVTPADMLLHSLNLTHFGLIDISRIH